MFLEIRRFNKLQKVKQGVQRQTEVALGVPGRLRTRIISTFGTTRVVGRQLYAPAAFTPGDIPGTLFQMLSRPQGTWFCRKEPRKKSPVTPQGTLPQTPLTNCTDKNLPTYPTQVVHAIGQPVSRRLLTAYVRVRAQASSCGIYGC